MQGVPISEEGKQNLERLAARLLAALTDGRSGITTYDRTSVKALSENLDANRHEYLGHDEKKSQGFIVSCGALLGQAIIGLGAPGQNIWVQVSNPCIRITTSKGETVMADPFARVAKHLREGSESSIMAYFIAIENIIRNGMPK